MTEQFQLDLFPEVNALLADELVDRRRFNGGPARLLAQLVRQGLHPAALRAAAALVVELDRRRGA